MAKLSSQNPNLLVPTLHSNRLTKLPRAVLREQKPTLLAPKFAEPCVVAFAPLLPILGKRWKHCGMKHYHRHTDCTSCGKGAAAKRKKTKRLIFYVSPCSASRPHVLPFWELACIWEQTGISARQQDSSHERTGKTSLTAFFPQIASLNIVAVVPLCTAILLACAIAWTRRTTGHPHARQHSDSSSHADACTHETTKHRRCFTSGRDSRHAFPPACQCKEAPPLHTGSFKHAAPSLAPSET